MESNKQYFYLFGRRVACLIYDAAARELRLKYRSGRDCTYIDVTPVQLLALVSGTLKKIVPSWISALSPFVFVF